MSHIRQQIRDTVVTALTGLATTADRVFVGRTRPLRKDHAPTLLIYTTRETSARASGGRPPTVQREPSLFVEGRVTAAEPPDDLLDTIAAEVEPALALNDLGGLLMDIMLVETQVVIEAEGERHNGGIRMEFKLTYRAAENNPTRVV